MSEDNPDRPAAPTPTPQEALQAFLDSQRELWAAAAARRAAMTPEQRAAEDRAEAAARAQAAREKLIRRFKKMGAPVLSRESWTIGQFSWLLAAENPLERGGWFDTEMDAAAEEQKKIRGILESCVDTRLAPLNPTATTDHQRFTVQSLLAAGQVKQLGQHKALAEIIAEGKTPGHMTAAPPPVSLSSLAKAEMTQPIPTTAMPPALAKSIASRETQKARRQSQLVKYAREIAEAGGGTVHKDHIALSIHGIELNERFQSAYPEWASTAPKTLEEDRRECRPRIKVVTGRRPVKNSR